MDTQEDKILDHAVAVVVDPACGHRIESLSQRIHVWAVESLENRKAAQMIWDRKGRREHDLDKGLTLFKPVCASSPEEVCLEILPTIDEHHGEFSHDPPWRKIEILGAKLTDRLRQGLAQYGINQFDLRNETIVCFRPLPPKDVT